MRRTFPKLRQIASERDVFLTEVDLRWGITEEESKTGKVVDICLRGLTTYRYLSVRGTEREGC